MSPNLDAIAARLHAARRVLFITGAGLSADSGLPTYRGIGGLYEGEDTDEGIPIEEALSGAMLKQRPALCWRYIHQIEAACRGARPNRGHAVIAEVEASGRHVCVLTQNVDGLHRAAGSQRVIDIHGDVKQLLCTACDWQEHVHDYGHLTFPPACPTCGALVRPDVVLFGELLPLDKLRALHDELADGFDAVFSIGTTSVFPYIARPFIDAHRAGLPTVEINPTATTVSSFATWRVPQGAAVALDAIWSRARALA